MSVQTDDPVVKTEMRGQTLWIWINREQRRNAINGEVIAGIEDAVLSAQKDPAVRAIVLTGVGRKAFCAGADLTAGTDTFKRGLDEPTTDFGRLARIVRAGGIPMIARVNGDCVAGGMALMSLCDLAIVADHARFGLPEAKVGVFPMQVLVYLRRLIGARHVNELCLTGALISAARASEMGIANSVVSYDDLDSSVDSLVANLSAMSPVALRRGKYAIAAMETMGFEQALAFAETSISVVSQTDDAREGLAAFNEKRSPRWIKEPRND
jgi:enoyl-CoA hydratase/carnithine racemase